MKFQSLEALRGVAAVMVVLFHSIFYSSMIPNQFVIHSDLFVDFFFVLSGFVMSYAYQDKIGCSIRFKDFLLLRIARLYPLHLFTLVLWVPYVLIQIYAYQHGIGSSDPAEKQNFSSFLMNLFFLQSLAPNGGAGWNWPSWSVSIEFLSYLIFYIYLVVIRNKKDLFGPLFILLIAYIELSHFDNILRTDAVAIFRGIGGFFSGIFIYRVFQTVSFEIKSAAYATILEFLVLALMFYVISHYSQENKIYYFLSIVSFSFVVYIFALQSKGLISQLLNTNFPQYIGKLSFSIYLTHGIILAASSNIAIYIIKLKKNPYLGAVKRLYLMGHLF